MSSSKEALVHKISDIYLQHYKGKMLLAEAATKALNLAKYEGLGYMPELLLIAGQKLGLERFNMSKKCIIEGCPNHWSEGVFVGDMCATCHEYLLHGTGEHSQAYRNTAEVRKKCLNLFLEELRGGDDGVARGNEVGNLLLDACFDVLISGIRRTIYEQAKAVYAAERELLRASTNHYKWQLRSPSENCKKLIAHCRQEALDAGVTTARVFEIDNQAEDAARLNSVELPPINRNLSAEESMRTALRAGHLAKDVLSQHFDSYYTTKYRSNDLNFFEQINGCDLTTYVKVASKYGLPPDECEGIRVLAERKARLGRQLYSECLEYWKEWWSSSDGEIRAKCEVSIGSACHQKFQLCNELSWRTTRDQAKADARAAVLAEYRETAKVRWQRWLHEEDVRAIGELIRDSYDHMLACDYSKEEADCTPPDTRRDAVPVNESTISDQKQKLASAYDYLTNAVGKIDADAFVQNLCKPSTFSRDAATTAYRKQMQELYSDWTGVKGSINFPKINIAWVEAKMSGVTDADLVNYEERLQKQFVDPSTLVKRLMNLHRAALLHVLEQSPRAYAMWDTQKKAISVLDKDGSLIAEALNWALGVKDARTT